MRVQVLREPITPGDMSACADLSEPGAVTVWLKASDFNELDRLRVLRGIHAVIREAGDIPVSQYGHLLLVHTG